jgi:disulfide bond formation protein DsbB
MTDMSLDTVLARPRVLPALVVLISAGALAAAFVAQYGFGLQPCVLCIYQRYAYGVALGLGVLALLYGPAARALMVLAGLAFLGGAAIAGFHVGVEQHWWEGTAECHAPAFDPSLSVKELREQMMATDFAPCDAIPWSLFGVSMAGYNLLFSLLFASAVLWAALGTGRTTRASERTA